MGIICVFICALCSSVVCVICVCVCDTCMVFMSAMCISGICVYVCMAYISVCSRVQLCGMYVRCVCVWLVYMFCVVCGV